MLNSRSEPFLSIESKIEISRVILKDAFSHFIRPAVVWSADRNSTATLHAVRSSVEQLGIRLPPVIFADHGDHFPETLELAEKTSSEWNFRLITVKNQDLLDNLENGKPAIGKLNEENRKILENCSSDERISLSHSGECFRELSVNVPVRKAIARYRFDSVIIAPGSGLLGNEDPGTFISREGIMPFSAVIPFLTFLKSDFWKYTFDNSLPVHPKYREGYSSVFCISDNRKNSEGPVWETEMEGSSSQTSPEDRERMMEKLRALGYI